MRSLLRWVVRHPALVNLTMAGICLLGVLAAIEIPKEVFPDASLDMIVTQVVYPGAGPQEVEQGILLKIEDALDGVAGIKQISGEARENIGVVQIEVKSGADTQRVLQDVKNQIDQIATFPRDAEKPSVYEVVRKTPVIRLALYGNASRSALQTFAERVKDDLLALPAVEFVSLGGVKEREISVEISRAKLRQYGLRIADVSRALQGANLDLSGGKLKTNREDFLIRVYGKRKFAKSLGSIVVKVRSQGGAVVRLRDIATLKETFEDKPQAFYFNGQPALLVDVMRSQRGNALEVGAQVKRYLARANKPYPHSVKLSIQRNFNVSLRGRISLLLKNGGQGLLLILLTLTVLMSLRLAFWVAAGLPVALLGTALLLQATPFTINVLSLFGLILVIGILVDDAIIVAENIYAHLEQGKPPLRAAVDGAYEVMPAVFAAVATTMLAFVPLFFMGGLVGKFIIVLPAVVLLALFMSLVESFLILPAHLAHSLKPKQPEEEANASSRSVGQRIRGQLERGFAWFRERYGSSLRGALAYRWWILGAGIAMLLATVGLIRGGVVSFIFFPRIDANQIVARVVMQPGTPQQRTRAVMKRIEQAALDLAQEWKQRYNQEILRNRSVWVGRTTLRTRGFSPPSGAEVGEVQLKLLRGEVRKVSSFTLLEQWRNKVGHISGAKQVNFDTLGGPPLGRALEFQLSSQDMSQLRQASAQLQRKLSTFQGVSNPQDDLNPGKQELRFQLTPLARQMGVTLQMLALQLRYRVRGQEVMRLQRGHDEVRLFVRYPEADLRSIRQLNNIWIQTARGARIPLRKLATWHKTRDLKTIRRTDRKRIATVFANLDDTKTTRGEILAVLRQETFPAIRKTNPDVSIEVTGQGQEQAEVFAGMKMALPLAFFGIFMVLVAVFQSYSQGFLVLSVVPFGLIGAVGGHWLMGEPLTILSFFGVVGLVGMVINDSLVLIYRVNQLIVQERCAPFQAVWQAGQDRLRAILSTTLTTFAGLAPLLFEQSLQARFLIPMAISISFGIVFASFITLFLVPSLYLIFNDIRGFFHWLFRGVWPTQEDVDPIIKLRRRMEEEEQAMSQHKQREAA